MELYIPVIEYYENALALCPLDLRCVWLRNYYEKLNERGYK